MINEPLPPHQVVSDPSRTQNAAIVKFATDFLPGATDLYSLELAGRKPIVKDQAFLRTYDYDRMTAKPFGAVQRGLLKERNELFNFFDDSTNFAEINKLNILQNDITFDDIEVFKYIPNARMAYINKLIKTGLASGLSMCDVEIVPTISMSDNNKKRLRNILQKLVTPNKNSLGFTIKPTNRAGAIYTCNNGKLEAPFYNPGTVPMYDKQYSSNAYNNSNNEKMDDCSCHDTIDNFSHISEQINDFQNKMIDKIMMQRKTHAIDDLNMDPKMKKLFIYARDQLNTGSLSSDTFEKITSAFSYLKKRAYSPYVLSVINPFVNRYAKIPSDIPIPSTTFSLRANLNLTTNALGNVVYIFNPFSLSTANSSTFYMNNSSTLTGLAQDNFFYNVDIGQTIPAALYSKYRLVSSAIKTTFTSSQLSSTGFSTTAIDYVDVGGSPVPSTGVSAYQTYGNFNLIENAYFKDTRPTRNGESFIINYLPLDSSYTDFQNLNNSKLGTAFVGYISGAQPSAVIARLDLILNFEAVVASGFTDYLPCQIYTGNSSDFNDISKAISYVREHDLVPNADNLSSAFTATSDNQISDNAAISIPPLNDDKISIEVVKDLDKLKNIIADRMSDSKNKSKILSTLMETINPIANTLINKGVEYLSENYSLPSLFGDFLKK